MGSSFSSPPAQPQEDEDIDSFLAQFRKIRAENKKLKEELETQKALAAEAENESRRANLKTEAVLIDLNNKAEEVKMLKMEMDKVRNEQGLIVASNIRKQERCVDMQKQIETLKSLNGDLEIKLVEAEKKKAKNEEELKVYETRYEDIQSLADGLEKKMVILASAKTTAEEQAMKAKEEAEDWREKHDALQAEKMRIDEMVANMEGHLQGFLSQHERQMKRLHFLEMRLEE